MFNEFSGLIEKTDNIVWGFPTVALLIFCGVFLTIKLRFFQFTQIPIWLENTLFAIFKSKNVNRKSHDKSITQFQAFSTALAATIGTGNIAGVATAISAGGPGAVFWMWVSASFGMMTSYSENVLGIYYRKKDTDGSWLGGPMYYINHGLSRNKHTSVLAKPLSFLYAFMLIGASFGIGNMTQANAISEALHSSFNVPLYITGICLGFIAFLIISGGVKRIVGVTEKLVPFMALFYIIATACIFISNYKYIPYVFSSIFSNAFSFKAVYGSLGGITIKRCLSVGFRRGVFSNEAGLGASVTASSGSDVTEPAKQGMWGIFQVFIDTMVVCTMTAFVILSTSVKAIPLSDAIEKITPQTQYVYFDEDNKTANKSVMLSDINASPVLEKHFSDKIEIRKSNTYSYTNIMTMNGIYDKSGNLIDISLEAVNGVSLVMLAFQSKLGTTASVILSIAIVLFAFSTIIGWFFYGTKAIGYIYGTSAIKLYKLLFIASTFLGAVLKLSVVWNISDIFNGLMALPNLLALFTLSGTVFKITDNYLRRYKGKKLHPILSYDEKVQFDSEFELINKK